MGEKAPVQPKGIQCLPQFQPDTKIAQETIQLLQKMVRVNTTNPPGNEIALATVLREYVEKERFPFLSTKIIESEPTRANLIIDVQGTSPDNHPSWGFMSHLDVVPAEGTWIHPPFAADLIPDKNDRFIWGRGTMDIKSLGAAHLIALLTLLREGFRPQGNLKVLLCADEEQGGKKGMGFLVQHNLADVKVDCCINEGGGFKLPLGNDFVIQIGEKGVMWTKLRIRGVAGHGSSPPAYNQFAIFKLIKVFERLKKYKPPLILGDEYAHLRDAVSLPGIAKWLMARKTILRSVLAFGSKLFKQDLQRLVLPLVQDTIAPTNFHSGVKENSISPTAEGILDIRTLPGHDRPFVNNMLKKAIGPKLFEQLELEAIDNQVATTSPIHTPEFAEIKDIMREMLPGANLVPMLGEGSTDCKYYREKGLLSYGFSPTVKDADLTYAELFNLAHGENERISVKNLMIQLDFAYRLMKRV